MSIRLVPLPVTKTFKDKKKLEELNFLLEVQDDLSPGLITKAVGCTYTEALALLLTLYELYLAEGKLFVYDRDPPRELIETRPFSQGYPSFPITYSYSGQNKTIRSQDQVVYALEFRLSPGELIQFTDNEPMNDA